MEFTGKIHVRELEQKTVEVKGDQTETWVKKMLEQAAPSTDLTGLEPAAWAEKSEFKTDLRVEKMSGDYIVTGALDAKLPSPCSRCGDLFTAHRESKFQVLLHPTSGKREEKLDPDSGDADYVFFKSDNVNLLDILSEQLVVLEPVAECPKRQADGTCTLCGDNPQFVDTTPLSAALDISHKTAGQEVENKAFSALSAHLKKIEG